MVKHSHVWQVFWEINNLSTRTSFGIETKSTPAKEILLITNKAKLIFLLKYGQAHVRDGTQKRYPSGGQTNIIATDIKPFKVTYYKNRERVTISCHYTACNKYGVPLNN